MLPVPSAILDPLLETWEAGRLLLRCHNVGFGATEFNPGLGQGRFHPFVGRYGVTVPVLYASDSLDGVLSETIFHGVATSGHLRLIQQDALRPLVVSTLAVRRDLCLAQLHGHGLRRLGLTRRDLIDSEADGYAASARWAQALHRASRRIEGLVWVSRQHDRSLAVMLFGDRVERRDLQVAEAPVPLLVGRGFEQVQTAAEAAGITIVE